MLDEALAVAATARRGASAAAYGNRILDGLDAATLGLLLPRLEALRVEVGDVVAGGADAATQGLHRSEPGGAEASERCLRPVEDLAGGWAIFPGAGTVIARIAVTAEGRSAQVAMVGAEGVLSGALDHSPWHDRLQVLVAGAAFRIGAADLAAAALRSRHLAAMLADHDRRMLATAWQGLACAALHPVEQRVARWLAAAARLAARAEVPVTQDLLARLLGVRRTTVTRAIAGLEAQGVIVHRRGRVLITDQDRLRAAACDCEPVLAQRLVRIRPAMVCEA